MKPRVTAAKLKRAAEIAKSEGVSVRVDRNGEFIIEPKSVVSGPANDDDDLQAKIDAMGRR